jgi:ABC-type lipoprotein export system ATPase subunit
MGLIVNGPLADQRNFLRNVQVFFTALRMERYIGTEQPILKVNDIGKVYGKKGEGQSHALNGITFTMERGEFVGIMGPSGSGKTTLLNIISTLDQPTAGTIRIADTDVTGMRPDELSDFRSRRLGFIFQDFNLLETLTVHENVALPLYLQDVPQGQAEQQVRKVVAATSCPDRSTRKCSSYFCSPPQPDWLTCWSE